MMMELKWLHKDHPAAHMTVRKIVENYLAYQNLTHHPILMHCLYLKITQMHTDSMESNWLNMNLFNIPTSICELCA